MRSVVLSPLKILFVFSITVLFDIVSSCIDIRKVILGRISACYSLNYVQNISPSVGIELSTFGFLVERSNHYAIRVSVKLRKKILEDFIGLVYISLKCY